MSDETMTGDQEFGTTECIDELLSLMEGQRAGKDTFPLFRSIVTHLGRVRASDEEAGHFRDELGKAIQRVASATAQRDFLGGQCSTIMQRFYGLRTALIDGNLDNAVAGSRAEIEAMRQQVKAIAEQHGVEA